MGIKDRIAAANERAEAENEQGEEELEGLLDELDSLDEGNGEPRPAWVKDEEESSEEPPAEEAEESAAPSDSDDDEDDGRLAEIAKPEDDEAAETETEQAAEIPDSDGDTPSLDTLQALNFDVTGLTEKDATKLLNTEFRGMAQLWGQTQEYAKLGQQVAPHLDVIRPIISGGQQPPPKQETAKEEKQQPGPKPREILAEMQQIIGSAGAEPEYDQSWEQYVAGGLIKFDGQNYAASPTHPQLFGIAEKLNSHRRWEKKRLEVAMKMPETMKSLAQSFAEISDDRGGLTMQQVDEYIKNKEVKDAEERFAMDAFERNKAWMFKCDAKGVPVKNPITNHFIPTPMGVAYYAELKRLEKAGMRDSRELHYYALAAIGKSLADSQASVVDKSGVAKNSASSAAVGGKKSKPAGQSGENGSAAKTPAEIRLESLQRQKKRATHAGNASAKSGQAGEGSGSRKKTVGEMMTEEFMASGIMPKKRRDLDE